MAPDSPVNAPYHHGDLRASALQMGMERLESQEQPDLGLRALARDLGVSATALYRHFPNKDALLDALALEGLTRLGAHQAAAAAQAGGGRDGFAEVGVTYVKWAGENPALLRLIYNRARWARPFTSCAPASPPPCPTKCPGISALPPRSTHGLWSMDWPCSFSMARWPMLRRWSARLC